MTSDAVDVLEQIYNIVQIEPDDLEDARCQLDDIADLVFKYLSDLDGPGKEIA